MSSPSKAVDVLPCPFCGSPGYVERTDRGYWVAGCDGRECDLTPLCTGRDQQYVIAVWNRRAALSTIGESQ